MIEPGATISKEGKVKATLKYVEGYHEFWEGNAEMQKGNYFPLKLTGSGTQIEVKKNGTTEKTVDWDPNWVIRVEKPTDKFEFIVDGKSIVTLDFSEVTLIHDVTEVITARDGNLDTFNKKVSDLQDDVEITNISSGKGEVTGISKWVTGYSNPAGSIGNWIALHIDNTKLPQGEVKYAIDGKEAAADTGDWNVNIRIDNKVKKDLEIKVDGKVYYTLDLSKVTLYSPSNEVTKVLPASHQMGNKPVSQLQDNIEVSKEGKITGTSKYITGLELSGDRHYPDGNYICLHVDKDKLPKGTITLGINNLTAVDTKDYDVLLSVSDGSKQKPLRVAVDNKILYEYDLSELTISPKQG